MRMDFYEYIAMTEPEKAHHLFRKYSRERVTQETLGSGLKHVMRSLPEEEKADFLRQLAAIHKDAKLIIEANSLETDTQESSTQQCGCQHHYNPMMYPGQAGWSSVEIGPRVGANGLNAVGQYMASGEAQSLMIDSMSNDLSTIKNDVNTRRETSRVIIQLVVLGLLAAIAYKVFIKK